MNPYPVNPDQSSLIRKMNAIPNSCRENLLKKNDFFLLATIIATLFATQFFYNKVFFSSFFQRPNQVVAIKAITKKNLAKSQNLLGKEIKILKVRNKKKTSYRLRSEQGKFFFYIGFAHN